MLSVLKVRDRRVLLEEDENSERSYFCKFFEENNMGEYKLKSNGSTNGRSYKCHSKIR